MSAKMALLWLKNANKAHIFFRKFVGNKNSPYFCSVFFMVLDLRLTRLVVVRQSIFLCKCKGYRPLALCPLFFFRGCVTPWQVARIKKDGENSFPHLFLCVLRNFYSSKAVRSATVSASSRRESSRFSAASR